VYLSTPARSTKRISPGKMRKITLACVAAGSYVLLGSLNASAHHSVSPSRNNIRWSTGSAPTPKPGYRSNVGGWLVRDEALRRRGYTPGTGSCVRNPLTCSSGAWANPSVIFPAFASDRLGGRFLDSQLRSVRIFSADIRPKTGNEMRVAVRLVFDGYSKKGTAPLRRTTTFWAPSKTYKYNLGEQCEDSRYKASGMSGFFNRNPWGWERHFAFDTDRSKMCDDYTRFGLTSKIYAGRDGTANEEIIINTGDFPNPVEITVLSNGYAVAYVRCSLGTRTCQWTYPSIWSKGTADGAMWTSATFSATPNQYKDSIHRGWARAFANADKATSQPIDQNGGQQNQNLSIAAQSMYILKARCVEAANRLARTGNSHGSGAVIDTAENCLRIAGTGSSNSSNAPDLVVDPRAIGEASSSYQEKNVCQLLPASVRQTLSTELTRLGRPHSARCSGG